MIQLRVASAAEAHVGLDRVLGGYLPPELLRAPLVVAPRDWQHQRHGDAESRSCLSQTSSVVS